MIRTGEKPFEGTFKAEGRRLHWVHVGTDWFEQPIWELRDEAQPSFLNMLIRLGMQRTMEKVAWLEDEYLPVRLKP